MGITKLKEKPVGRLAARTFTRHENITTTPLQNRPQNHHTTREGGGKNKEKTD